MMLAKTIKPKTKAELIRALQAASFKAFDLYEGSEIDQMPSKAELARAGVSVIVLR